MSLNSVFNLKLLRNDIYQLRKENIETSMFINLDFLKFEKLIDYLI